MATLSRRTLLLATGLVGTSLLAGPAMASELLDAAQNGDIATVTARIAAGDDLEARDGTGATALLVATHANNVEIARLLIEAGADVNAEDDISDSPYLYAGARGHLDILRLTLNHGADLASINRFGGTALIPAAERGHVDTVATLIEAGVAVDHVNRLGWTALLEAIILGDGGPNHIAIVQLLLAAGADPDLADAQGVTPLAHARSRGFTPIADLIAAAGGR